MQSDQSGILKGTDERTYPLWKAVLLPWSVLLILFFPIFSGRIPVNGDWLISETIPWQKFADSTIKNPEIDDPVLQGFPLAYRAAQSWSKGRIPLWNPDIACGMPLLADCHSQPFDPLYLVSFLTFKPDIAWGILIAAQYFLLALAVAGFMRIRKCCVEGANIAAVSLVLSGACVTWCEMRLFTGTLLYLVFAMWAVEINVRYRKKHGDLVIGVLLAGMVYSGHLQFIVYAWILLLLYSAYRMKLLSIRYFQRYNLMKLTSQIIWGVFLSAPTWIPVLELLTNTMRGEPGRYFKLFRFGVAPWITMICPDFLGNPATGIYYGTYIYQKSYMNLPILYFGLIPLFFAIYSFGLNKKNHRFFAVTSIVILGGLTIINWHPIRYWIYKYGPGFFSMDPGRLALFSALFLAVLAGDGVHRFKDEILSRKRTITRLVIPAISIIGFTIIISCLFFFFSDVFFKYAKDNSILLYILKLQQENNLLILAPQILKMISICAGFIMIVLASCYLKNVSKRIVMGMVALMIAADMLPQALLYLPFTSMENIMNCSQIKSQWPESNPFTGRICGIDPQNTWSFSGEVTPPNSSLLINSHDFRGYVSAYVKRYAQYIDNIQTRTYFDRRLQVTSSPFFDVAGIRWMLFANPVLKSHLSRLELPSNLSMYENKRAFPKAWFVNRIKQMVSVGEMFKQVNKHGTDLGKTAYIEKDQIDLDVRFSQDATVSLIHADEHHLVFNARTPTAGFMVVNDTFYPGWNVTVYGKKKRCYPTDYLFRGVFIDPGQGIVEFEYHPVSFLLGMFSLNIGILLIMFRLVYVWRPSK